MDNYSEGPISAENIRKHRRHTFQGLPRREQTTRTGSGKTEALARALSNSSATAEAQPPVHGRSAKVAISRTPSRLATPVTPHRSSFDKSRSKHSRTAEYEFRDEDRSNSPRRRHNKTMSLHHQTASGVPDAEQLPLSVSTMPNLKPPTVEAERVDPKLRARSMRFTGHRISTISIPDNSIPEREKSISYYSHSRSRRMLHLMSITRGNAKGRLYFRKNSSPSWQLEQCSIDTRVGSLVSGRATPEKVLVQNLRGCRVQTLLDPDLDSKVLVLKPLDNTEVIHLRPEDPSQADRWFAALLCWQPVHPQRGVSGLGELSNFLHPMSGALNGHVFLDVSGRKDAAIIKVSKVLYLDPAGQSTDNIQRSDHASERHDHISSAASAPSWQSVSCTLRTNGELKLYTTADVFTMATVRLSDLTRSSVQRIHRSVFGFNYCIMLSFQQTQTKMLRLRPRFIYIAFDSRVSFEVWFTLLRSFTGPEVYGSGWVQSSNLLSSVPPTAGFAPEISPGLFRIERSLHLQVAEARLRKDLVDDSRFNEKSGLSTPSNTPMPHYSCHLMFGDQSRARTSSKPTSPRPFWYETLDVVDLAFETSHAVIQLVCGESSNDEDAILRRNHLNDRTISTRATPGILAVSPHNTVAEAVIELNVARTFKDNESWLPLIDQYGDAIGEILVKLRIDSHVILMDREYHMLSSLLHRDNASTLTSMIADHIPSELARLAECLLDIYQASGRAVEWLKALAEEEIEGTRKESSTPSNRHDARGVSQSSNHGEARAAIVRGLNNAATAEVNLLFRGNTLLSKALDCHMKRLGKDYLEGTIGELVRAIALADPDCEVDPNKLSPGVDLSYNWGQLMALTSALWSAINDSASRCPPELRTIFRHIRACAEDHYGERLRSVRYSSVSGFLFLRFFCPAILSPRLFGLLTHNPLPNAQRTFTLIAKSLQVLANQAYFGIKEPWMEPMNQFLSGHKLQFREFVDSVCNVFAEQESTPLSPSYSTPLAMFTRLPPSSREGFPSLPYLIDHTQQFAILVNLWLDNFDDTSRTGTASSLEPDLIQFHETCLALRKQSQKCLAQIDRNEKRESNLPARWMAIARMMEAKPADYWVEKSPSSNKAINTNGPSSPSARGRTTPSPPPMTPENRSKTSDYDGVNTSASDIGSRAGSSAQLSSTASSEREQDYRNRSSSKSTSPKGQSKIGEGSSFFGLFGWRKQRYLDSHFEVVKPR